MWHVYYTFKWVSRLKVSFKFSLHFLLVTFLTTVLLLPLLAPHSPYPFLSRSLPSPKRVARPPNTDQGKENDWPHDLLADVILCINFCQSGNVACKESQKKCTTHAFDFQPPPFLDSLLFCLVPRLNKALKGKIAISSR